MNIYKKKKLMKDSQLPSNGGTPVVMSPITPKLAYKMKGELGSPQIIVPAGAFGMSIDCTTGVIPLVLPVLLTVSRMPYMQKPAVNRVHRQP